MTQASIGSLLQYWRKARSLSQLALAHEAEVSPRHLCFLETGRARPSREMVLQLAGVLDVPLRERNAMLLAAGFAPVFTETPLDAQALGPVRAALDAILRQQEPYPAVVMNRHWDIVHGNVAAQRFFARLLGAARASQPSNVLRLFFDPTGVRPHVLDWESVAGTLLQRVTREAVGGVKDSATEALLAEVLAYPDVPRRLLERRSEAPPLPIIPVRFRKDGDTYSYFSTVTMLGTPLDINLQELRIECFFPTDEATKDLARQLSGGQSPPSV